MLRVRATQVRTRGITRDASSQNGTRMAPAWRSASPTAPRPAASRFPRAGISTMSTTTARSSTSVIPIMTRPWRVCSSPRSVKSRTMTIVLAMEITMPTTSPWIGGHPRAIPDAQTQADRKENAERRAQQRDTPDLEEVAKGELEPDREHQEDDPDVGEQLERVKVGHRGAGREGADQDAPEDVAEDQGLAREPGQTAAEDGGGEHVGQVTEYQRLGHHVRAPSSEDAGPGPESFPSDADAKRDGRATRGSRGGDAG